MDCNPGLHLLNSATGRLKRGYNYEGSIEWNMTNATDFPFDIQEVDIRFYTESNWSTPGGETTGLAPKERQYCKTFRKAPILEKARSGIKAGTAQYLSGIFTGTVLVPQRSRRLGAASSALT